MEKMQITGRIVAIQEQRFRLLTDAGQVYLLTLGRHAPLDATTLGELHDRCARVTVEFSGEPNLTGGVAYDLREDGR
jgi:hypothetical protein